MCDEGDVGPSAQRKESRDDARGVVEDVAERDFAPPCRDEAFFRPSLDDENAVPHGAVSGLECETGQVLEHADEISDLPVNPRTAQHPGEGMPLSAQRRFVSSLSSTCG